MEGMNWCWKSLGTSHFQLISIQDAKIQHRVGLHNMHNKISVFSNNMYAAEVLVLHVKLCMILDYLPPSLWDCSTKHAPDSKQLNIKKQQAIYK